MIKKIILAFTVILFFAGCKKSSDNGCGYSDSAIVAPASEVANLQAYVNATHPAAIQHSSGFFYEIIAPGSGSKPNICSSVTVKYTGWLTNGFKFDEELVGVTFKLGQLIVGWQKGIPLIAKGGSINLFLPPSLGYGGTAQPGIPANSILIFNIQLTEVQ